MTSHGVILAVLCRLGLMLGTTLGRWASLVAQRLKHLPPLWETWVRSLGREDPLEKEMATHSYSYLENPLDGGAW